MRNNNKRALYESIMSKVSKEVKRALSEAGHLYWRDEDGHVWTNSKVTYRGVSGTTFISHGAWSDPEVIYKGHSINATDIEDMMYSEYREYCHENGEKGSEDGYEEYIEDNGGEEYVRNVLDELVYALS